MVKTVLVCALVDIDCSFTIQEMVAISAFVALNVGKGMKYRLFLIMSITQDTLK